jgi:hypothetical protein
MFCAKCGQPIPPSAKICGMCGTAVAIPPADCGRSGSVQQLATLKAAGSRKKGVFFAIGCLFFLLLWYLGVGIKHQQQIATSGVKATGPISKKSIADSPASSPPVPSSVSERVQAMFTAGAPTEAGPLKNSTINVDTFGCRTIEMSDSAMSDKKPLPAGCFDLNPLTRVRGPLDLKTRKSGEFNFTYALIEVPQKGRMWVFGGHIDVFPDSVQPSPLGQAVSVTAEDLIRNYNDAQYQGEQVTVTGLVHSANFAQIEMHVANSAVLEFTSGTADFPRVSKGQKVTIRGRCLWRRVLKDQQQFVFQDCSIVSTSERPHD